MGIGSAILIICVWAAGIILGLVGKVTDNEDMVSFADILAWAAAGFGTGCALSVLVNHAEETKEPQIVSQQCVSYNGTEYCGKQHIETETRIIDVDGNGNITIKIK